MLQSAYACALGACAPRQEKPRNKGWPPLSATREGPPQQQRPSAAKPKINNFVSDKGNEKGMQGEGDWEYSGGLRF